MRKKSADVSLRVLRNQLGEIREFLKDADEAEMSLARVARCYDHAVIWCYRAFEDFVLDILVAQINRNPHNLYEAVGVNFGKNPTAAQCEYLLIGDRYFDFRGHSGLVEVVKKASGRGSALEDAVKARANRECFDILVGLRNYIAHQSDPSREAALRGMRHWEPTRRNLGRAGNWLGVRLKGQSRMERLLSGVDSLADAMRASVN